MTKFHRQALAKPAKIAEQKVFKHCASERLDAFTGLAVLFFVVFAAANDWQNCTKLGLEGKRVRHRWCWLGVVTQS